MNDNEFDDTTSELLRAAERSLFDATVRLEEALAAMDGRRPADAQLILAQARRWAEMIAAGLDKFSPEELRAPTVAARAACAAKHSEPRPAVAGLRLPYGSSSRIAKA
jgi:hypothetical protein